VLAILNIAYAVPGLTGYVIVGALALYSGYAAWGRNGLGRIVAISLVGLILLYAASGTLQDRIHKAVYQYSLWQPGVPASITDSTATRLEFYRNTLSIIREHPLVGAGTGSFPRKYAEELKRTGMFLTGNPHNEYLLIAAQIGLIGVALLINLFWQQWRLAPRLASPLETHVARGLVLTMATGCLFNSLLLDHTEGLLYAWLTGLLYAGLQSKRDE
jgi:O-antigen ligase